MMAPPTTRSVSRFKADESSAGANRKYRRNHPEDNNERQSIHEHESIALGKGAKQRRLPATHKRLRATTTCVRTNSQSPKRKTPSCGSSKSSTTFHWLFCSMLRGGGMGQVTFATSPSPAGHSISCTTMALAARSTCRKPWVPGCAFIDYDNDGYPDILLVNGETDSLRTALPR